MAELSPVARALLETISGPESAGNYDIIYGGSRFNDFSDHPRQFVTIQSGPNKGQKSSAAGKYQFLGSTWDDQARKLGLSDFSPESQDRAAWNLASEEYRRDTGRDLEADLAAGDLSRVAPSLRNQWTSMPGGIEQGITGDAFTSAYQRALSEVGQGSSPALAYNGLPSVGATGGPALGAINAASPPPAPAPPSGGGFWSNPIASLMNVKLPEFPQIQPEQKKSLMGMAMGSLPVRSAFTRSLMGQNIGPAPRVSRGHSGPGTRAMAVSSQGSEPVTLSGNPRRGGSGNAHMNMDVYRSNAAVLGGRGFNQQNINNALAGGRTLMTLA